MERPRTGGVHHAALTATDVPRTVRWWGEVFGYTQMGRYDHDGGYGVLLQHPDDPEVVLVVHGHEANDGQPFSERRTGLDHLGISVPTRADLDAWATRLAELGVEHSPPVELEGFGLAVLVLRDPDGVQLELVSPA